MNPQLEAQQPSAIVSAIQWFEGTLVGTMATTVSIIAVGWFGLRLLSGHVPARRGAQIIFGCFIIFGASSIAAGITGALTGQSSQGTYPESQVRRSPVNAAQPPTPVATPAYDPYAGAALPPRR